MQYKTRAIVLKVVRYRDSDLIVNLLSEDGELISALARSALKSKKRFGGGALEPTHHLEVVYQKKPSDDLEKLVTLTEAKIINGFEGLRSDYDRLQVGLEIVMTVNKVLKSGATEQNSVFSMLGHALKNLESHPSPETVRLHFLARFLNQQGVLPHEAQFESLLTLPMAKGAELNLPPQQIRLLQQSLANFARQYF